VMTSAEPSELIRNKHAVNSKNFLCARCIETLLSLHADWVTGGRDAPCRPREETVA